MSFDLFGDMEKFMPKKKNGNGKKKSKRKNGNGNGFGNFGDFGGIGEGGFGDIGAGFNGRFGQVGSGFLESVNIGRQPSINFSEGGRSDSAISPLFQETTNGLGGVKSKKSKGDSGFGDFSGFEKSFKVKKVKKKKSKSSSNGNGNGKETVGGFISRKLKARSERKKAESEKLPETEGETGSEKSQSRFTKEDLEREEDADRRTQEKLELLIEQEKQRRAKRGSLPSE